MPRLYAYGIAAVALLIVGFGGGWTVNGWRAEAREKAAVKAAAAAEKAAQQNVIDKLRAEIKVGQESSNVYQAELTRLRNAAALKPAPVVRVCKPSRSTPTDLPRAADTPSRPDATSSPRGVLPEQVESDIGPDLALLSDEADRCSAQLRGLIDWVERTR